MLRELLTTRKMLQYLERQRKQLFEMEENIVIREKANNCERLRSRIKEIRNWDGAQLEVERKMES